MWEVSMCTNTARTGEEKKIPKYCNICVIKRMKTFNIWEFVSSYHGITSKSKGCAGGGNIKQWLDFFFIFFKETDGKHLNNSWRSNWFFWLEGLAPFDLSSPEEKLINTEVWGAGGVHMDVPHVCTCLCTHCLCAYFYLTCTHLTQIR